MKTLVLLLTFFLCESVTAKTDVHLVKQGSVAASSDEIDTTAVVPTGRTIKLKKFGGLAPAFGASIYSYIVLQWGEGSSWETIRAGYGTFEYSINRDFTGDGSNRFRIIRKNSSAAPLDMAAWVEALVKD